MPQKRKELYFWHIVSNPNRSIINHDGKNNIPLTPDEYVEYFKDADQRQVTGEACPSYLYYHDHVLENLKKYHSNWPKVKIVIILREPVNRIISQYQFVCKENLDPDSLSFSASLKAEPGRLRENRLLPDLFYLQLSKYSSQVSFYLKNFENVYICLYDDLKENPRKLLDDLCVFLGVDRERLPDFEFEVVNASKGAKRIKYPLIEKAARRLGRYFICWLPKSLKKGFKSRIKELISEPAIVPDYEISELRKIFYPEIKKLETIIGRDLSCWIKRKK